MTALLLALALLAPGKPTVGFQGTGATYQTAMAISAGFPVVGSAQITDATLTLDTTAFSAAANTTIVVAAAVNRYTTVPTAFTIAWTGSTPAGATAFTKQVDSVDYPTGSPTAKWEWSIIATATTTQALSSVQVRITSTTSGGSTAGDGYSYAVWVVENAGAVGVKNGTWTDNAAGVPNVTLAGVTAGSFLFIAATDTDTSAAAPSTRQVSGTSTDREQTTTFTEHSMVGHNFAGASGSVSIGWTVTGSNYNSVAAMELKKP